MASRDRPRHDPTSADSSKRAGQTGSVVEYYEAFKAKRTTPLAVVTALLDLIAANPKHQKAFLSIKRAKVIAAAEESTNRYNNGRPISELDGIPVGIKDEVDLEGHVKTLATCKTFPSPKGTSWCVKKWEEAGAIIIGKLNMHELGLGEHHAYYLTRSASW